MHGLSTKGVNTAVQGVTPLHTRLSLTTRSQSRVSCWAHQDCILYQSIHRSSWSPRKASTYVLPCNILFLAFILLKTVITIWIVANGIPLIKTTSIKAKLVDSQPQDPFQSHFTYHQMVSAWHCLALTTRSNCTFLIIVKMLTLSEVGLTQVSQIPLVVKPQSYREMTPAFTLCSMAKDSVAFTMTHHPDLIVTSTLAVPYYLFSSSTSHLSSVQ